MPVYLVSRGYFRALGIGLQTSPASAGWDDAAEHSVTAIASKALAARFWRRGTAAFGKSVRGGNGRDSFQIAALADDVRANGCDRPPTEALYLPLLNDEPPRDVAVVVRTQAGTSEGIAPRIRRELAALDAQVAMTDVRSMAGIIASSKARITFSALLLGVASTLALLLTAIGIYSLLSYLVVHRRSEISIRLALGAQRGKVTQLVISHSLKFATAGLTLGLAAALFITRLLQSLLFEVSSTDPATLGFVSAVLLLLTVAASWVPVHRATRIPPWEALRHE